MSENCTSNCSSCGKDCESRKGTQIPKEAPNASAHIKKVIGIVSGKGGVGKSLVTSLIAATMQRKNYNTAILDADITGPSIPHMFGVHERAMCNEAGILPAVAYNGTKIMSINLLVENATDPVVWRGPVIASAVKQFWTDVCWGDIDYMFVDMPPGTGDVPLTVFQSLPVDGIIVVTQPQELVGMIVGKAVKMAEKLNVPIIGIVENMSYFVCPNCNEKHYIFGNSHIEELAKQYGIEKTVQIPMNPEIAKLCDSGRVADCNEEGLADLLDSLE